MDVADVTSGFAGVTLEAEVDPGGASTCVEVVSADAVFTGDVPNVKPVDDVLLGVAVGVPKTNPAPAAFVVLVFVVDGDPKTKPPEEAVELAVVVVPNTKPPVAGTLLAATPPKVNPDLPKMIMNMYFSKKFLICILCSSINSKFSMSKNTLNSEALLFSVTFKIVYINLSK